MVFETLLIIKGGRLSTEDEKRCRTIDGMFAVMRESETNYRKRVEFTNLIASLTPGMPRVALIDFTYLKRTWHETSENCHKHLRPENSFEAPERTFQKDGINMIREFIATVKSWDVDGYIGLVDKDKMPAESRDAYEKFVRDEIDIEQARRLLILMEPVLKMRQASQEIPISMSEGKS